MWHYVHRRPKPLSLDRKCGVLRGFLQYAGGSAGETYLWSEKSDCLSLVFRSDSELLNVGHRRARNCRVFGPRVGASYSRVWIHLRDAPQHVGRGRHLPADDAVDVAEIRRLSTWD